jgi:hypothetical protein
VFESVELSDPDCLRLLSGAANDFFSPLFGSCSSINYVGKNAENARSIRCYTA